MTDNEKLQLWQTGNKYKIGAGAPDYLNDDAAAMSLLDTLVEKGFYPTLTYSGMKEMWEFQIIEVRGTTYPVEHKFYRAVADTRRAGVCAAVLDLIERETLSGKEDV